MLLYASKNVIFATKEFIDNPNRDNFLNVIFAMRNDLWIRKNDLKLNEVKLK